MSRARYLAILLSLIFVMAACQSTQEASEQLEEPGSVATANVEMDIPTDEASPTDPAGPAETQALTEGNPDPVTRDKPLQSQASEIRPQEMRTELTHLSNLIGYQVLDENGDKLGVASDYIVNTCETYIIYILMEPVASLKVAAGSRIVIPFEAVTINSGVLDAQNKTIQLRLM